MDMGCKKEKCEFWEAKEDCPNEGYCADELVYKTKTTGEYCCRYHPDAVLQEGEEW